MGRVVFLVALTGLLVAGCGEDATDNSPGPGSDAGGVDMGTTDTAPDTPGTPDAGDVEDTGSMDAGGADTPSADVGTDQGAPQDTGQEVVSFVQVFDEILAPRGCTAGYCHAGHAGGLLMDSPETAYENLVNQDNSTETTCEATVRVVPGDPDASMLWVRVRPAEEECLTQDQKMPPFGNDGLTEDELALIRDWILTGANP